MECSARAGRTSVSRRWRDGFTPRRASRSFPFISKTMNCNFISLATRVMLGQNAKPFQITTMDIDYVRLGVNLNFNFGKMTASRAGLRQGGHVLVLSPSRC